MKLPKSLVDNLVLFSNNQKQYIPFNIEKLFYKLSCVTFEITKTKKIKPISVSLVSKNEIKKINKKFRNINKITDVISFSFKDNKMDTFMLGEMYICVSKAYSQAKKYNHSFEREISFLFVHGLLHILGYNHIEKKDEEIMFKFQKKILNKVGLEKLD